MSVQVLMILGAFGAGGAEKRFSQLYKYLVNNPDQDVHIDFLVPRTLIRQLPSLYQHIKGDCIKLIPFGMPYDRVNNSVLAFTLRRIDQLHLALILLHARLRSNYTVAHFINFSALQFCRLVRADRHVWSCFNSEYLSKYLTTNRPFKKLSLKLTNIDCLSSDIAREVKKVVHSANCLVHTSPCSFIDYDSVTTAAKDKLLTFSGGLRKYKGIDLLVPALKRCLRTCPELNVQILGRGEMEGFLRSELKEYIAARRVSIEHVERPPEKLKSSLMFVSLQECENYPSQSLIEAMATGNAIIATNVGQTHLLVTDKTGIRINRDVDELVDAVEYLYYNKSVAIQMGKAGSSLVRSEHNASKFWHYLKAIYLSSRS